MIFLLSPGLEKVVYSSVTKSVAAAPEGAEKDKKSYLSTEANSSSRLYRSALSLNNVDRKNVIARRDDKFLRGSTTSLVNPTREIPIEVTPEVTKRRVDAVDDDDDDDVSPVRPPRKVKAEKEISKKDLFFDLGASPQLPSTSPSRLKSSTSYSELARTSMLNSNYLKGQKYPSSTLNISKSPETQKHSANDDFKRKSYFFGEASETTKTTHFPADPYAETVDTSAARNSRTPDRRKSPEWISDSYLRVQSEPPLVKGQPQVPVQPQPIREEVVRDEAKVRRIYPTVEKRNSRQSNVVYRSESRREPKRLTFHSLLV